MKKNIKLNRPKVEIFFLLFFIVGHIIVQFLDKEFWPFSTYPMYSDKFESAEFSSLRLYGVLPDQNRLIIPVYRNFQPFWDQSLFEALESPRGRQNQKEILSLLLTRFNQTNKKKIISLQLQKNDFSLERQLELFKQNPNQAVSVPTREILVAEVYLD